MLGRIWPVFAGVAISLVVSSTHAQSVPEAKCTALGDISKDERIAGCTTLLESNKYGLKAEIIGHFIRARTSFHKGDFDGAIADYTEIIRLNPKNEYAYLERGVTYFNKHDFDLAIADYDRAIELNSIFENAFYNRGAAYFGKGEFDRAIADYDQALQLNPKDQQAYVRRGAAYRAKGKPDRAVADCAQAMQLNSKNKYAYYCRGVLYKDQGDLAHAIADYDHVIELDPKDAGGYRNRATAYFQSGMFSKSLADFDQSLLLDSKSVYIRLWRDLAARRANEPSRLSEATAELDMTKWPAPVLRLFLGEMPAEAVLAAADDANAWTRKCQTCEANFYIGEFALQRGKKAKRHGCSGWRWPIAPRTSSNTRLPTLNLGRLRQNPSMEDAGRAVGLPAS